MLSAGDDGEDSDIQELAARDRHARNSNNGNEEQESVSWESDGDYSGNSDDDEQLAAEAGEEDEDDHNEADEEDVEGGHRQEELEDNGQYYRPNAGEDIYGRSTTGDAKYIPPAQRAAALRIDETSQNYILLKVEHVIK